MIVLKLFILMDEIHAHNPVHLNTKLNIECCTNSMPRKGVRKRLTWRKHHSLVTSPVLRPAKRKQWTDSQLLTALKAVESGTGINKAAREHGVSATTLKDRVSGHVAHGTKPGPRPYLSTEKETELGTFLKNCASVGYGKTRKDVLLIAESVTKEKDVLSRHQTWQHLAQRRADRVSDLALQPNADIDLNTCCTCFVRYEDDIIRGAGTEWISCACGRWLHEDCAEDCVAGDQGNDCTCPICLDILMT